MLRRQSVKSCFPIKIGGLRFASSHSRSKSCAELRAETERELFYLTNEVNFMKDMVKRTNEHLHHNKMFFYGATAFLTVVCAIFLRFGKLDFTKQGESIHVNVKIEPSCEIDGTRENKARHDVDNAIRMIEAHIMEKEKEEMSVLYDVTLFLAAIAVMMFLSRN